MLTALWVGERWWRMAIVGVATVLISSVVAWSVVSMYLEDAARLLSVAPERRVKFVFVMCLLAVAGLLTKSASRFFYGCIEIGCALAGARYVLLKTDQTAEALFAAMTAVIFVLIRGAENCLTDVKAFREVQRKLERGARARKNLQGYAAEMARSADQWAKEKTEIAAFDARVADREKVGMWLRSELEGLLAAHDREDSEKAREMLRLLKSVEDEIREARMQMAVLIGKAAGGRFRECERWAELDAELNDF